MAQCGWYIDGDLKNRCREQPVRGKAGRRMGAQLCVRHLKEYDRRWGGEGPLHHEWDGRFPPGEEPVK